MDLRADIIGDHHLEHGKTTDPTALGDPRELTGPAAANIRAVNRNTRTLRTLLVAATCVLGQAIGQPETVEKIANEIRNACSLGDAAKAAKLAMTAFKNTRTTTLLARGRIHEEENQPAKAEADYTPSSKNRTTPGLYHRRGVVRFQLKFDDSLADFDKFIEMVPGQEPYHWQRGLHYYMAVRGGRKQFGCTRLSTRRTSRTRSGITSA